MDRPKDKTFIKAVVACLKVSQSKIRLDECHDYVVYGSQGKIFAVSPYWYVYYDAKTPLKWKNVKKKLSFMYLQNDGDWEGIFRADFPPDETQSKIIRKLLKIRQSTVMTEAQRARLFKPKEIVVTEGV